MKNDYNLDELEQVTVRGLLFNIMPRYKYHYMEKDYEQFSLDLINRLVKPGSTVLDIGAHYGIYSLLASKNAAQVYAFEPVKENYEILKRNIADNNLINVKPLNKAVSDQDGTAEFNIPWASDSAGFYEHPNAESMKKVAVKTARIDSEIDAKDISFIKIDTEGHELHVLDGLQRTLRVNKRAVMLIELNPECLVNAGSSAEALIAKIHELGYDILALHEASRDMVRVELDTPLSQVMRGEQYLNLLCLPVDSWLGVVVSSHSSSLGGAELYLYETLLSLLSVEEKLVLPHVIVPGEGPLYSKLSELPITTQVIASRGWVKDADVPTETEDEINAMNVDALSSFSTVLRDFRPHVVLSNTVLLPWAAIAAKMFAIPHVWAIHEFGDKDHNFVFKEGYANTLRLVDEMSEKLLVTSDAVYKHIERYVSKDKMEKMQHRVSVPLHTSNELKVFSKTAKLKLVVAGRISSTKGQLDAVKALVSLRSSGYNAELLLLGSVGSTAYMNEITKLIKKHTLEKFVHIVGHVDNPGDYISQADIYLMCSSNEAFGRVTVEAMILGKPVIGTDSGQTPYIVEDGKTGYLYTSGDVDGLVLAIRKLADSPTLIRKFGKAGFDFANNTYTRANDKFWYSHLLDASKVQKNRSALMLDIGKGLATLQRQHKDELNSMSDTHRREIKEFSDSYNAVYAAYHKLEKEIERYRLSRVLRKVASRSIGRMKK